MIRVGTDLIEIGRIRRSLDRYAGFRDRCFTPAEQAYCDARANPAESYAGRFAGKEAVGKALGLSPDILSVMANTVWGSGGSGINLKHVGAAGMDATDPRLALALEL